MENDSYCYQAFGLIIGSNIKIPALMPAQGVPDVTISMGKVPDFLGKPTRIGACYQTKPGRFLFSVDRIARYLVSEGKEIIVETCPGAGDEAVRTFLLGSVFAALLHQRNILPLHGSSIRVNGKCLIFAGLSGSGKSTTAWALMKRGYQVQSDNVSAIFCGKDGIPFVYPEYPQLKLWKDVLIQAGKDPESYKRVRGALEKFAVPSDKQFNSEPLPLEKIYILTPWNKKTIAISPVQGMDKFKRLKRVIHRQKFTSSREAEKCHFRTAAHICSHIPFARVERPIRPCLLKELADLLEKDFSSVNSGL